MSDDPLVLIAEDSLVLRALLRSQLRERGYAVMEAADGEQALEKARTTVPDVVLLDIEMPKLDGFAVLDRMKAEPTLSEVPVVFISGRTNADDAAKGLDHGAHDYLRKPFEAAELAARVHAALRTKGLQDELRTLNAELERQACTDMVTGLYNRGFLDGQLARLCSRSARHNRPLALLLADVDGFRAINEQLGHEGGDRVLGMLAARLRERARAEDLLGRWGGEEFIVAAPDTDAEGAAALAEALRAAVAARPLGAAGAERPVTVSIGWATWRGDTPDELVRRATEALAAAQAGGGDTARGDVDGAGG